MLYARTYKRVCVTSHIVLWPGVAGWYECRVVKGAR